MPNDRGCVFCAQSCTRPSRGSGVTFGSRAALPLSIARAIANPSPHSSSSSSSSPDLVAGRRSAGFPEVIASLAFSCLRFLAACPEPEDSDTTSGASADSCGVTAELEGGSVRNALARAVSISAAEECETSVSAEFNHPPLSPSANPTIPSSIKRSMWAAGVTRADHGCPLLRQFQFRREHASPEDSAIVCASERWPTALSPAALDDLKAGYRSSWYALA